jgi:hypothetical protein
VLSLVGAALLAGSRQGHLTRCLRLAYEIRNLLRRLRDHTAAPAAFRPCADPLGELLQGVDAATDEGEGTDEFAAMEATRELKASALAQLLVAQRHYMTTESTAEGGLAGVRYDPRFLLFEFVYDVLLHQPQVRAQASWGSDQC